jgi:hypothetical protein
MTRLAHTHVHGASARRVLDALVRVDTLARVIMDRPIDRAHQAELEEVAGELHAAHELAIGERPTDTADVLCQVLGKVLVASGDYELDRWRAVAALLLEHLRRDLSRARRIAELA